MIGQNRRSGDEARDHGFRDVARDVAEPRHGDDDLDDADHHREQEHRLVGVEPRVRIDEGERAEDDQRNRAGRTVDQMARRAEEVRATAVKTIAV